MSTLRYLNQLPGYSVRKAASGSAVKYAISYNGESIGFARNLREASAVVESHVEQRLAVLDELAEAYVATREVAA